MWAHNCIHRPKVRPCIRLRTQPLQVCRGAEPFLEVALTETEAPATAATTNRAGLTGFYHLCPTMHAIKCVVVGDGMCCSIMMDFLSKMSTSSCQLLQVFSSGRWIFFSSGRRPLVLT
jgi:hypothetical protein